MSETSTIIKRLRARGLSQSEIARRTGIPQPRLSRWEASNDCGSADDALRLSRLDEELSASHGLHPVANEAPAHPQPSGNGDTKGSAATASSDAPAADVDPAAAVRLAA